MRQSLGSEYQTFQDQKLKAGLRQGVKTPSQTWQWEEQGGRGGGGGEGAGQMPGAPGMLSARQLRP